MKCTNKIIIGLLVAGFAVLTVSATAANRPAAKPHLETTVGRLPLAFEANQGQVDGQVEFLYRGRGYTLFLSPAEATLALHAVQGGAESGEFSDGSTNGQPDDASVTGFLRMRLVGANASVHGVGLEKLHARVNYLLGDDPQKWYTEIPTHAKVKYGDVYPGIDLVYYGSQQRLEHDFVVHPGSEPATIQMEFLGADKLKIDAGGDLVLHLGEREVALQAPVTYQDTAGARSEVSSRYVLRDEGRVGFDVAPYDASRPLVIDPVLVYSTYLGGSLRDEATAIAIDDAGLVYMAGQTESVDDFPISAYPFQAENAGGVVPGGSSDVFITVLDPTQALPEDQLIYSTYLGGDDIDFPVGIGIDNAGNIYVGGTTESSNFPISSDAFQSTFKGGVRDAFVTKLDPSKSGAAQLAYSTYFGATLRDAGLGFNLDELGHLHLIGYTVSSNFPVKNATQAAYGGGRDGFVAKFDLSKPAPDRLVYSTYIGGSAFENAAAVSSDSSGNTYVTGITSSSNFATTGNAYQATHRGGEDAFVTKFDAAGALDYSTYFGGSGLDNGVSIAVADGNIYFTGRTSSSNLPTKNAAQGTKAGAHDVFVAKLDPSETASNQLVYSTYLGGSGEDYARASFVNNTGTNYVVGGTTSSENFPTQDPLEPTKNPSWDSFISMFDANGALEFSTYFGGNGYWDGARSVVLDQFGNIYFGGITGSTDLPVKDAFQSSPGGIDAYLTKISLGTGPDIEVAPAALSLDFGNVALPLSSNLIATISNIGAADLTVTGIALTPSSSENFDITLAPVLPAIIPASSSEDVGVTFTPTALGTMAGGLEIVSDDPDEGQVLVALIGEGVASEAPPSQQIDDILNFIDESVAGGSLEGDGPGASAAGRLNALINQIEAAGDLVDDALVEDACDQLLDALERTDGEFPPPDFVTGDAAAELELLIQILRGQLDCD